MKQSRVCQAITLLVLLFLYLPIILLVANSFNQSRFGGEWLGFSLKWYHLLFQEKQMWIALKNSLLIALTSTLASTILGTFAAFALHFYKTKMQQMHYFLIYTPLIIPDILMGVSLLLFFFALSVNLGLITVIIAHTTFCISYVAMVMISKLQNFDFSLVEAAEDLGANKREVVRTILLPLLTPGLFAAALLSFTLSIDDFVITFFLAGEGMTTLPLYIYSKVKFGATPTINALATLILGISFISVCLIHTFSKEETP